MEVSVCLFSKILTFLSIILACECQRSSSGQQEHTCHPISIPMCQEMPYNATKMPNLLGHRSQEEAAIMAHEFLPLVDINCSELSRLFICSVFAPMCTPEIIYTVPTCRSVCETVKKSCLPILLGLNFTWPTFLQCESFPKRGLCMNPLVFDYTDDDNIFEPKKTEKYKPKSKIPPGDLGESNNVASFNLCSGSRRVWVPSQEGEGVCAPLCHESFLYTISDKKMAVVWGVSWALACLASTLFSVLTFALDTERFKYPERPVICLALSYLFYCLPFIIRSMSSASSLSCELDASSSTKHLAASGATSSGCFATFLLQYYFGFASDFWWTILTFCWFMSTSRCWRPEGLQSLATYFHLVAWGVPAIGTVLVITFKQIDGDELTGLCYVGNLRPSSLLFYVLIPQAILLSLGTVFIVCGFVSLVKIRNLFKKQSMQARSVSTSLTADGQSSNSPLRAAEVTNPLGKLERLIIRLGVFSALSTIPAFFVLAFRLHAFFHYQYWVDDVNATVGNPSCQDGWYRNGCSSPRMVLALFRIFMSLVVGVFSGIWVWSPKTLLIWKRSLVSLSSLKFRLHKPYDAVPRADFSRTPLSKGTRPVPSPGNWSPNALDSSTARASITSSGHYLQRNSESSYV